MLLLIALSITRSNLTVFSSEVVLAHRLSLWGITSTPLCRAHSTLESLSVDCTSSVKGAMAEPLGRPLIRTL